VSVMSPSSKIRWCQCVEVRELHHDDSLGSLIGSLSFGICDMAVEDVSLGAFSCGVLAL
jgi:hypothetical protein